MHLVRGRVDFGRTRQLADGVVMSLLIEKDATQVDMALDVTA
jgi:hypothetical protein